MRIKYNKIFFNTLTLLLATVLFESCKKFVDAGAPAYQSSSQSVYSSDATAIAVMTGLYNALSYGVPGPEFVAGTEGISLRAGLSADEYALFGNANATFSAFYKNALISNSSSQIGTDYWNVLYTHIFTVNSAIEGYQNSTSLTQAVKQQLLGEAKFMRAFFYFYLVNMYGDVPLVITSNYKVNANMPRTSTQDVYKQIISDLMDAQNLLSSNYLDGNLQKYAGSPEKVRPTKWAATALLARVYLYTSDYANAEAQATAVINQNPLFSLSPLNSAFLKNSSEAILQLQVVYSSGHTDDADMFIITTGFSNSRPVRLSDTLMNSFEATDARKIPGNWVNTVTLSGITYYYPYKYKSKTNGLAEYEMLLRLGEQYLIRAEARAHLNNIGGAQTDLNTIRNRAGLGATTANDQASLLIAILHERQVELFSEWGHRWFDLKRTNNVNSLMTVITSRKGGTWISNSQLYPIPYYDLSEDPSLTQNSGY